MRELERKTIGECLRLRSKTTPSYEGISYQNIRYTWKEIDEITDFLALSYMKQGITCGTHAAIWSVNSPNWIFCFFSLIKIGAIPVLVNTCYKTQELESLLERMNIEYLFHGMGIKEVIFQEIIQQLSLENLPALKKVLFLEEEGGYLLRGNFSNILTREERTNLEDAISKVSTYDTACILPTSGTTSRSKGVMLSHYSLINNAAEICCQMHWGNKDKFCISVPLFHCFGITTGILAGLYTGASLHILKYYKTIDVLQEISSHRCTTLNGVPTMFLAISRNEKRNLYDLSSLKSGIVAGSPISASEYQTVCSCLKIEKLQMSYGQTESSPCITISEYEDTWEKKSYTAGKAIPNIKMRIWDLKKQMEADVGEQGEIQTKGYHVMQGYYSMELETKQVIDSEGWLHTGDMGRVDIDGYLQVTGRIKDMIIRGGENISPLEIEECIGTIYGIEAVKVVGVKAEVMQEEIAACIVPQKGCKIDQEQVKAYVKTKLADYKVPKYILIFEAFPLGASGKVQTEKLRKQVYQWLKVEEEKKCF